MNNLKPGDVYRPVFFAKCGDDFAIRPADSMIRRTLLVHPATTGARRLRSREEPITIYDRTESHLPGIKCLENFKVTSNGFWLAEWA